MDDFYQKGASCNMEELFLEKESSKNLTLHNIKKASSFKFGVFRSNFRGRGMEFFESRAYVPQDEIRHMDWKVSARLNTPFTKVFVEERQRPIFLLIDQTSSMCFGTKNQFKSVLAAKIASFLGSLAINGFDKLNALIMTDEAIFKCKEVQNNKSLSTFFNTLISKNQELLKKQNLEISAFTENLWQESLFYLQKHLKSGSSLFIISDFYNWSEKLSDLTFYLSRKANTYAICLTDNLEENLPKMPTFKISYDKNEIIINSLDKETKNYWENKFKNDQKTINNIFANLNIPLISIKTNDDHRNILIKKLGLR